MPGVSRRVPIAMTDCCIKCGTPFPANRDLVAVPNGRSLVIDRGNRHAWRVCYQCAEWELLGPERSGALIAELTARLPHYMRDEAMHHDVVGGTTVVLLPTHPDAPVRSEAGLSHRQLSVAGIRMLRYAMLFGAMVWAATILVPSSIGGFSLTKLAGSMSMPIMSWLGLTAGKEIACRRAGLPWHGGRVRLILVLAAVLAVISPWAFSGFGIAGVFTVLSLAGGFTVVGGYLFALHPVFSTASSRISGSRTYRVSEVGQETAIIDISDGEPVIRGLPEVGSLSGRDAVVLVKQLFDLEISRIVAADIEAGWLLLRQHGDLSALVKVLLELRPDDAGGIPWREISRPWQAALGLASAEATGKSAESERLLARLPRESAVAALARTLVAVAPEPGDTR